MRVGIVSPYDLSRPGGVQAQVLGLAKTLREAGIEALAIGPNLPEGVEGVDLGSTITVPGNRSNVPVSLDPRLSKVLTVVSQSLDLLHVHEPLMPMVSLAALRAGPPVVATFHADPPASARTAYRAGQRIFRSALGPNVAAITAVSPTAAGVIPEDVEVRIIPNAVGVEAMRSPSSLRDPRKVVFLGRDEPRKGLDVLLEAWAAIAGAVAGTHLTVLGAHRDIDDIEWLDEVSDEMKTRVLNEAAVYVAPNTGGESFGIVLIEAMAAGAAVVASDLRAFRHVGARAVRFFPVGDPQALADTVVAVLTDDQERNAMASRGIERARDFDWEHVMGDYLKLYQQVLS